MNNIILFFVLLIISATSVCAQVPINWNKLYEKSWKKEEVVLMQPDRTVTLYSRGKSSPYNFDSVMSIYHTDGTKTGINIDGKPFLSAWEKIDDNHILSKGDPKAAEIIKLTDNEFIVQIKQTYKSPYTNEEKSVISQTKYISFDPCAVYMSLRSGNWNDPTIWTCQKIPTSNDEVQVNSNHTITVPDSYIAHAKKVIQRGKIDLKQDAKLILDQ